VADNGNLDDARTIYSRSGIGGRVGLGERPAVLVVDFQYGVTETSSPLGGDLDAEIAATASLLAVARERGLPIAFTAVAFQAGQRDRLVWLRKMPSLATLVAGTHACEIDERVKPAPTEPVFEKQAASAFFGTSLIAFLQAANVDSLIVCGCVTSGCVRASVVDAVSWGYRTVVPAECVGDRATAPHDANMFDMDSKYADVISLDTAIGMLTGSARPLLDTAVAE
jgi:maleamate amidohydrolase